VPDFHASDIEERPISKSIPEIPVDESGLNTGPAELGQGHLLKIFPLTADIATPKTKNQFAYFSENARFNRKMRPFEPNSPQRRRNPIIRRTSQPTARGMCFSFENPLPNCPRPSPMLRWMKARSLL
jgi:hypothetical protein